MENKKKAGCGSSRPYEYLGEYIYSEKEFLDASFLDSLTEKQLRRVCFIGAGGKTSLMMKMAEQLSARDRKTFITTTTHMYHPDFLFEAGCPYPFPFAQAEPIGQAVFAGGPSEPVIVGRSAQDNPFKMTGLSDSEMALLTMYGDCVLVEADGSRGFPMKYPAGHEPALPGHATLVVLVLGLDAVGRPIGEVCFRAEEACEYLHKRPEDAVTMEDLGLLAKDKGLWKVPEGCPWRVVFADRRGQEYPDRFKKEKIALILTGAGLGRRFGGENKLLHRIEGRPMLAHILETTGQLPVYKRILVTRRETLDGFRLWEAQQAAAGGAAPDSEGARQESLLDGVDIVINPEPQGGISGSIRLGIGQAPEADAYLFSVCDQPYLTKESFLRLIKTFRSSGKGIVSSTWQGRMGNPNIFSACYRSELLALRGDGGGKSVLRRHAGDFLPCELAEGREQEDIDTRP